MKKKILIGLGIVVLVLVVIIGYLVVTDLKQEDMLLEEASEITTLTNEDPIDVDKVRDKLDNIITRGDYAVVERAFKDYLSDIIDNYEIIYNSLDDSKMVDLLSIDNYREDGKDFNETLEYLTTTQNELKTAVDNYVSLFEEDMIMSYIDDKGLDSYYVDFYRDILIGEISSLDIEEVEESINQVLDLLQKEENIINFLVENKDNWEIQDDNIVFNDASLTSEYLRLVDEIVNS